MSVKNWLAQNWDRPASLTGAVDSTSKDLCQTVREHARAGHLDQIDQIHLETCPDCRQAVGEVH